MLKEWGEEECIEDFDGKAIRKRPLGRPRLRKEDNIIMGLREIGCDLKGPIHDQSCCAKLFCATEVCPFTIKSISTIHDQSCCTTRNVAQHD
jgi:hypothetical protein